MITEFFVKECKQLVEQKRCGNHRRSRIVAKTVTLKYLRPPAQLGAPVKNRHGITLGSQAKRSRDAAEARTDNDRVLRCTWERDKQAQSFNPIDCE